MHVFAATHGSLTTGVVPAAPAVPPVPAVLPSEPPPPGCAEPPPPCEQPAESARPPAARSARVMFVFIGLETASRKKSASASGAAWSRGSCLSSPTRTTNRRRVAQQRDHGPPSHGAGECLSMEE